MAKYKVGDKVKVRSDLIDGVRYGGDIFIGYSEDMGLFKGQIVTIKEIVVDNKYTIVEDEEFLKWYWTDEMFESESDGVEDV